MTTLFIAQMTGSALQIIDPVMVTGASKEAKNKLGHWIKNILANANEMQSVVAMLMR